MPHEPGHTTNGNSVQYKIYGTNQDYNGNVVKVGDVFYTTTGNVLEGNSKQLVLFEPEKNKIGGKLPALNNVATTTTTTNQNPVVETFFAPDPIAGIIYYKPNGSEISQGAPLHRHQDGTIMTEHSMGPNDNSVVVTTTPPNSRQQASISGGSFTSGTRREQTSGRQANTQTTNQGNQGGGMGGGGSY